MGANTYRLMSGLPTDGEPGTDALADLSKIVFSSTLTEPLAWANTQLISQDPTYARASRVSTAIETVRSMKDTGSESMRTIGSLMLCRSLLRAGLVDRFRVVVFPVITGSTAAGKRAFWAREADRPRSGLYLSACAQVDARRSAPGTGVAVCAQPRRLTPPRMGRITPKN